MRKITTLLATVAFVAMATPALTHAQDAQPEPKNIVETAAAAGTFNTLAKALETAGLLEKLQGEGPFTVFAPTDEAFAKLPPAQLDSLLKDKGALERLLLSHVIAGEVSASQAKEMNGASAETVSGVLAQITVEDGKVIINQATVVQSDIAASNGVIHVIDSVIVPTEVVRGTP